MKTKKRTPASVLRLITILLFFTVIRAKAAIITFDNGMDQYKNYFENGVEFRVTASDYEFSLAWMKQYDARAVLRADSGSTHMEFQRDYAWPNDLVSFSPTNGTSFGVTSVDLAETGSSLHTASTVIFAGLKTNGSMVTNTFTTDGFNDGKGGLTDFQTFNFDSSFSSGLTSVQIVSHPWAMDNLVIVPEPGTYVLFGAGFGVLLFTQRRKKSKWGCF